MSKDIVFVLGQRLWQSFAGLVTMVMIAHFLTPVEQGWYYSFLSLAALGTLMDMGLSVVLVQLSAHMFIQLKWLRDGGVQGENQPYFESFLSSISRLYLVLAVAFILILVPSGWVLFHAKSEQLLNVGWVGPWMLLMIVTALNILVLPFIALVEGSGQVREVYVIRLFQGLLGALACWIVMWLGGGLWSTVMASGFAFIVGLSWLFKYRPVMLKAVWHRPVKTLHWREEIWSLQWRVGLSWLSGYLLTQIYSPILFHTQGAVVAGQMGLSLAIANMLGLIAQSWIAHRVPAMAQAAGNRDWQLLDRLFLRDFYISVAVFLMGGVVLALLRQLVETTAYNQRVLPFWPFLGLLGVVLIGHVCGALAAQLRSFKREPLVWVSVLSAVVSLPLAIWAAYTYSAIGVVSVLLMVQLILVLPASFYVWKMSNQQWRHVI